MASPKSVTQVLREARALVEKGWWDGGKAGIGNDLVHCPISAVNKVARSVHDEYEADYIFAQAVGVGAAGCIPSWNDAPGRTQAEVIAAFDRAIALAEASHA